MLNLLLRHPMVILLLAAKFRLIRLVRLADSDSGRPLLHLKIRFNLSDSLTFLVIDQVQTIQDCRLLINV